jgi:hypothetical protein
VHSPLQDGFWGERHGQIIDSFGHSWGLAQHLEDVPHDEVCAGRPNYSARRANWGVDGLGYYAGPTASSFTTHRATGTPE